MDDFKNNLNKTPTLGDIVKIKKRWLNLNNLNIVLDMTFLNSYLIYFNLNALFLK
jgi:hypothetical protein